MDSEDTELTTPTIMTIYLKNTGEVNFKKIFYLTPISIKGINKSELVKKSGNKLEIPYPGVPGQIIGAISNDLTRGIVKKEGNKSFLNSVMFIMSISSGKNVIIKIWSWKFTIQN